MLSLSSPGAASFSRIQEIHRVEDEDDREVESVPGVRDGHSWA